MNAQRTVQAPWSLPTADPMGDLRNAVRAMEARPSEATHAVFMTAAEAAAYRVFLDRQLRYQDELCKTPRRRLLRRYSLQRKLGLSRRLIVLPGRVNGALWRVETRWRAWRYRDAPEWA